MNPRWLKQNLVTIIVLVVAALFIGVTVYFERQAASGKQQIEDELADQQQRLEQLRHGNPVPPSPDNLQSVKRDFEQLQQLYQSVQGAIGHSAVEPPKMKDEIEFGQVMRETIARLDELAAKNHVKIPDGFTFGFSRYGPQSQSPFPCRNPPAKPEDCQKLLTLLTKQLLVIEKVSDLAIDSGVEEIVAIRRPDVEPTGGVGGSADALAAAIEQDPKALYHTYPFEFQFACGAKALQTFLNSLSKSDWFFAVKLLKIDTETSTGSSTATTFVPGRGTTPVAPLAPAEKASEVRRLLVTARIALIEFPRPETKPAKAAEKKAGRES